MAAENVTNPNAHRYAEMLASKDDNDIHLALQLIKVEGVHSFSEKEIRNMYAGMVEFGEQLLIHLVNIQMENRMVWGKDFYSGWLDRKLDELQATTGLHAKFSILLELYDYRINTKGFRQKLTSI